MESLRARTSRLLSSRLSVGFTARNLSSYTCTRNAFMRRFTSRESSRPHQRGQSSRHGFLHDSLQLSPCFSAVRRHYYQPLRTPALTRVDAVSRYSFNFSATKLSIFFRKCSLSNCSACARMNLRLAKNSLEFGVNLCVHCLITTDDKSSDLPGTKDVVSGTSGTPSLASRGWPDWAYPRER